MLLIEGKTWTVKFGTLANSAHPDQTPQNAASDLGLHCLLKLQEVNGKMKQSYVPVPDHLLSLHSEAIELSVLSVL